VAFGADFVEALQLRAHSSPGGARRPGAGRRDCGAARGGRPNRYDLSRVVTALAKATEPVREADRFGPRTSPAGGRHQSVWRTGPVRLADPKDPKKEPTKEATAVRARETDVAERAKLVLADAREAHRLRPHEWAETRRVAEAYGRATGNPRPLSEMQRDSGLRAVLVLFAAGYSVADVEWVAANVPTQAWWRGGERVRGLGSLSVEVVARALAERETPRRLVVATRLGTSNSEDRRIHRNTLLENAEAGRYGVEIARAALSGVGLRELADHLEQREAAGELSLRCPVLRGRNVIADARANDRQRWPLAGTAEVRLQVCLLAEPRPGCRNSCRDIVVIPCNCPFFCGICNVASCGASLSQVADTSFVRSLRTDSDESGDACPHN
jgi:hypothetical protein